MKIILKLSTIILLGLNSILAQQFNQLADAVIEKDTVIRADDWPVGTRRVFEAWCVLVQNADKYPLMHGEPVEWVDEWKSVKASKDYSTAIGTVDAQLLSVDPGGLLWVQVYYKHRWGRLEVVADGP